MAAAPTIAELTAMMQASFDFLEEIRRFGEVNAKNFAAMQDTFIQALETDFAASATTGLQRIRSGIAAGINNGTGVTDWLFRQFGVFINSPSTGISDILDDLYDDFIANGRSVQERNITFGSPSSFGAGKGVLRRLTVDAQALNIENTWTETKIYTCISDQGSGATTNSEEFVIDGDVAGVDALELSGSGLDEEPISSVPPEDGLLLNGGFDDFEGDAAAPTVITDWDSSVPVNGTNFAFDEDEANIYLPRTDPDLVRAALIIKVNVVLTQNFIKAGIDLDKDSAYYLQLPWARDILGFTGTIQIELGSQSVSVVAAAQVGYQLLILPVNENLWFENFNQDPLEVKITITGFAGTGLHIDDFSMLLLEPIQNIPQVIIPAQTPFLVDETSTVTDTEVGAKIQTFIWRLYDKMLPHSAAPTIADPA